MLVPSVGNRLPGEAGSNSKECSWGVEEVWHALASSRSCKLGEARLDTAVWRWQDGLDGGGGGGAAAAAALLRQMQNLQAQAEEKLDG